MEPDIDHTGGDGRFYSVAWGHRVASVGNNFDWHSRRKAIIARGILRVEDAAEVLDVGCGTADTQACRIACGIASFQRKGDSFG